MKLPFYKVKFSQKMQYIYNFELVYTFLSYNTLFFNLHKKMLLGDNAKQMFFIIILNCESINNLFF